MTLTSTSTSTILVLTAAVVSNTIFSLTLRVPGAAYPST